MSKGMDTQTGENYSEKDIIVIETKDGKKYEYEKADYYINNGWLTVFREQTIIINVPNGYKAFYRFEKHFAMNFIKAFEIVEYHE